MYKNSHPSFVVNGVTVEINNLNAIRTAREVVRLGAEVLSMNASKTAACKIFN